MVGPVDMQVNLMKLGEIIQNVKNDQLQAIINDKDRSSEAERIKDVSTRATTEAERSERSKQVRSREEEARRGGARAGDTFFLDNEPKDDAITSDKKNSGTEAIRTRARRIDLLT